MKFRPHFLFASLLLASILTLPALAQGGSRPKGIAGIPFGATQEEVWRQLSTRSGLTLPEEMPSGEKFELTGGTFAGQEVQKWLIEFTEKKLSAASVVIKPVANPMGLYREIKQNLASKYGPATGERKAGSTPGEKKEQRRDNDKESYGNIAYWKFSPTLADKDTKIIVCEVAGANGNEVSDESQLLITLRYIDEGLRPTHTRSGALPTANPRGNAPVKGEDL